MSNTLSNIFQVVMALALVNVWLIRPNKETPFRGGLAKNLKGEFVEYGLPAWSFYVVGFLKIISAIFLIVGIWVPQLVLPFATLTSFLMLGAFVMHIQIHDSMIKASPALALLILSLVVVSFHLDIALLLK
jgi:hypothetical protein